MSISPAERAQEALTKVLWDQYEDEQDVFRQYRFPQASVSPHGKLSRYKYHGCRCDECTEAYVSYHERYRRSKGILPQPKRTHGSRAMYQIGCKCALCKNAGSAYYEEIRRKAGKAPRHTHAFKRHYYEEECRCTPCVRWHEEHVRRCKERRVKKKQERG